MLVRPGSPGHRRRSGSARRSCATTASTGSGPSSATASTSEIARRLHAVAGDVGRDGLGLDEDGSAALASCDVVIHSAATVSFDAPLDQAVEINLLGPVPGGRRRGRGPGRGHATGTAAQPT